MRMILGMLHQNNERTRSMYNSLSFKKSPLSQPSSMGGETDMLASNNLFTVLPDYLILSKYESESFHYYVAKIFFK